MKRQSRLDLDPCNNSSQAKCFVGSTALNANNGLHGYFTFPHSMDLSCREEGRAGRDGNNSRKLTMAALSF